MRWQEDRAEDELGITADPANSSLESYFPSSSSEAHLHCISWPPWRLLWPCAWALRSMQAGAVCAVSEPGPLHSRPALSECPLPVWQTRWGWRQSPRHSSRATKWKLSGSLDHHRRKAAQGPGRPTFDCYMNKKQICIMFKPSTFWESIWRADNPTPQKVALPSQEAGVYAASCVMKWFMGQMAQTEPQRNSTAHLLTQSKGLSPAVPGTLAPYPAVQGNYHKTHGEVRSEE